MTPSASPTTQSPVSTSTSPTIDRARRSRPAAFLVAPRNAIIVREHREAVRLERVDVAHTAVDHEPGEAARLRAGREHLAPVAALGLDRRRRRRARDPAGASATATWIARLSPGVHVTGNAGAAMRAPGHAGTRCAAPSAGRPLSPSVAAPSSSSSASRESSWSSWSSRAVVHWRRARDLNPRGGLSPPTRLAGEHLRPLGQPSGASEYTSGASAVSGRHGLSTFGA